ncbi:MAG: hypothetical protein ACPGU7_05865 [Gammaproteobacteria bacterium]
MPDWKPTPAACLLIVAVFLVPPALAVDSDGIERELRADHQAWQSARTDFDAQMAAGRLSEQEQSDYIRYIESLGLRVQESCARYREAGGAVAVTESLCASPASASAQPAAIDISAERTLGERSADADAELRSALGSFDEMLLREQRRVRAKADAAAEAGGGPGEGASGGGGGSAGGRQGANGTLARTGGTDGAGRRGEAGKGQGSGAGRGADGKGRGDRSGPADERRDGTRGGTEVAGDPSRGGVGDASRGGGVGPGGGPLDAGRPDIPADIPDGSDDDVVARQLREAAEKEKDPELRKRLWEEYRRYKAG